MPVSHPRCNALVGTVSGTAHATTIWSVASPDCVVVGVLPLACKFSSAQVWPVTFSDNTPIPTPTGPVALHHRPGCPVSPTCITDGETSSTTGNVDTLGLSGKRAAIPDGVVWTKSTTTYTEPDGMGLSIISPTPLRLGHPMVSSLICADVPRTTLST